MTGNQINYWALQETKRSNLIKEGEQERSNRAKELETERSNKAKEAENRRSNQASESISYQTLNENRRHNKAQELIGTLGVGVNAIKGLGSLLS